MDTEIICEYTNFSTDEFKDACNRLSNGSLKDYPFVVTMVASHGNNKD